MVVSGQRPDRIGWTYVQQAGRMAVVAAWSGPPTDRRRQSRWGCHRSPECL